MTTDQSKDDGGVLAFVRSVASRGSDQAVQETQQTKETQRSESETSPSETPESAIKSPPENVPKEEKQKEEGYELPLDQIFEILKNSRRRETLRYLKENGGETTLSEVAEHIAALENDTTVKAISSTQRKRVYVGLYQCHLPKMDDTDVVEFDQNRGTIELGPNVDQLDPYLDEPVEQEWYKRYMGVTFAGGGLFAVGQAGGASYGLTPTVVVLFLLVGITACCVTHFKQTT